MITERKVAVCLPRQRCPWSIVGVEGSLKGPPSPGFTPVQMGGAFGVESYSRTQAGFELVILLLWPLRCERSQASVALDSDSLETLAVIHEVH